MVWIDKGSHDAGTGQILLTAPSSWDWVYKGKTLKNLKGAKV